jgi:hypothetical protein
MLGDIGIKVFLYAIKVLGDNDNAKQDEGGIEKHN